MYSKRQIEIAEEHGVVLRAIPVSDVLPFDKIFLDTQQTEMSHRICKVFIPSSSFNCNCHRDVPIYKRRNKVLHTLVDETGKKYHDDVFEVYAQRVRHSHYCSKLIRYRYESDYKDDGAKYRPTKNHIQLTGQDNGLHTLTYTFENDETVFIVEDFGDTYPQYETVQSEEELYDLAIYDEEIENTDRYFRYALGWDSSCARIHHHRHNEGAETIEEHVVLQAENLEQRINYFQQKLEKINRLDADIFTQSKEAEHEMFRDIAQLKQELRYILRKFHFDLYDMGNIWDYISGEMSFDIFIKCIDVIDEIGQRLKTKKDETGMIVTVDDYYWILYGDKLKRKYKDRV